MKKYSGTEWVNQDILDIWDIISGIARDKYKLTWHEPQFEIVNEEGMLYCHSHHAMPSLYDHWSFGKSFIKNKKEYEKSNSPLAYEVIINSNPAICYLLSSNTLTTMVNVIGHAAIGHSSFFKNNYLFKEWTSASVILPFCTYAKRYIKSCEEQYGVKEVEKLIDILHSVQYISFDKTNRNETKTDKLLKILSDKKHQDDQKFSNHLFDSLDLLFNGGRNEDLIIKKNSIESSDNILRMFVKHGGLPTWKRNIVNIFMYINQYFYPQLQTKMMNEGWATFWDYTICNDLYDQGIIDNSMMIENIHTHGSVCFQSKFSYFVKHRNEVHKVANQRYRSINPYQIGFKIFKEIKRVCEEQDRESLRYVPSLKGKHWLDAVTDAMENFRDDSFAYQFLTPRLARELKLATVEISDKSIDPAIPPIVMAMSGVTREITNSHDDSDFERIRESLSEEYSLSNMLPTIKSYVLKGVRGDKRTPPALHLVYDPLHDMDLYEPYFKKTMDYIKTLWNAPVFFCKKENFKLDKE